MTDQNLPVPRPDSTPVPVERFDAHPSAHAQGLTPERSAKIVRQSASARWVAFLSLTVVALFVGAYFFYETGIPGVAGSARLGKEKVAQQVVDVSRGYKLYQANCARCHGDKGQGGIGPLLNDQAKLLTHLTPAYLETVLTVGGRYICGDSNSLMLAWLEPRGPLNYREIEELIAYIRATNTTTYEVKVEDPADPEKTVASTLKGWRDPAYVLPAGATPVPACWKDAFGGGGGGSATPTPTTPAPSGGPATPAPSDGGGQAVTLEITAAGVAYDKDTLEAPADTPFKITFINNDAGVPHNVAIHEGTPTGPEVWKGDLFSGVETRTYEVPALPAGAYGFVCTVHPNMIGTLTVK